MRRTMSAWADRGEVVRAMIEERLAFYQGNYPLPVRW